MVRKQNERTLLLQYRIIPLSLPTKTLFLILASRPLSTRLGAFSSPETFSHKIFPKIFSNQTKANFFLLFWCEKLWGLKALAAPQMGGGVPFRMLSTQQRSPYFLQLLRVPFLLPSRQIFRQSGQKVAKVNKFLERFCVFSGKSETRKGKI